MPKYELVMNAGDYAPVADRIRLFYARYPTGRILTRLVSRTEHEITFQAVVYRSTAEERPASTGWAAERIGDGDINTVACLENTETSAVGRALANLGLTASSHRPSREEMEKANRGRARRVAETMRASEAAAAPTRPRLTSTSGPAKPSLQSRADHAMDALDLLGQAERAGLAPRRTRQLRIALTEPTASVATIERIERLLRLWTAARLDAPVRASQASRGPTPA